MTILLIARLTVSSSYSQNREEPAGELFDTVQFYIPADASPTYRIRTFAVDHDIHVHQIDMDGESTEEMWQSHLTRAYSEVIASLWRVPIQSRTTLDLTRAGVPGGELELAAELGFAYWNPDGGKYATKSVPIAPSADEGMQDVVYLGGMAIFRLPDSWQVEMSPENGGCFYHPDSEGVLRLSVLTFDTSAAPEPPAVRLPRRDDERQIDFGRLPNDCDFDVFDKDAVEEGEPIRMRYWQIAQVLPGQCRVYLFSYTYPVAAQAAIADELAMVDREVRMMVPYPEPL